MKKILNLIMLIVACTFFSCQTDLDEVNIDPNNSPTAPDEQLLTSAIGYLSYMVDTDLNSRSFLWGQYYTWGVGVSLGDQAKYIAQPDDFNGYWGRAYANCLTDLKQLNSSDDAGYRGISKALQAYVYQGLVDHFGAVPFSEAISGEIADGSILTPKFDAAEDVYTGLVIMIDEAIADLTNAGDVGSGDLVYGGDVASWRKFANSLKLRILMRTSEASPQADAVRATVSAGNFIESESDIADIAFMGDAGNQNPMYARFEWGVGDFYFASNGTLDVLNSLDDPRADAFYSPATTGPLMGQLRGISHGAVDVEVLFTDPPTDYSGSSPYAYGAANSVILMSNWEVWFLRAEAGARYGTSDDDATAFETAVQSNFDHIGVAGGDDYIASLGYGGTLDEKLNTLAVQKWISMNGAQEDEGWIETRRFDRPGNRVFTGASGLFQTPPSSFLPDGEHPATWLYPATERSLNPNALPQRTLTDKIFWDN